MINTETQVIVVPSEYDQILDQLAEVPCPRCLGTQTIPAMSDGGPDAYEVEVCCDHCDGDGTARGTYKALAAFYGKARSELTQLRYYRLNTRQAAEIQALKLAAFRKSQLEAGIPDDELMPDDPAQAVAWLLNVVTERSNPIPSQGGTDKEEPHG